MPRYSDQTMARTQAATAERARRLLAGVGISREDSDDELGIEDHPWEWIYAGNVPSDSGSSNKENNLERRSASQDVNINGSVVTDAGATRKRSGRNTSTRRPTARIIGARMGTFECRLGDTVLLKAEGTNEAWVGLICDFEENDEEDEKMANIMWFSTEKEIRNKQKKRMDFLPNELYITPSWDVNPLASINGKATLLSAASFQARYPTGLIPKTSSEHAKVFICRRGCNTRTATYTEEFIWEELYRGGPEDIDRLVQKVQSETKATRKRRKDVTTEDARSNKRSIVESGQDGVPETPKKKRKMGSALAPKSSHVVRTPQKLITPTHKRIVVKKPLEFTPLGTRILSPSHILSSPFQVARSRLHVASVPEALPCREQEFETVYQHLEAAISEGSGSCIYISGTPGTGKTATVREVIAQLNASVLADELDDFVFVEINGMKVTDPHQAYSLLWEALRGDRVSPAHALDLLEREFTHPSPRRVPCVVLMDELDQLVTRNQSVMYNFFNWPGLRHSRLIVLAVANTMDLPERTLSNKISSRLGLTRITFRGYTHEQLMAIIQSRLEGVPGNIVDPDAIQFASRKVAAVSGDARRALDICRRAVEIAEEDSLQQSREEEEEDQESMPPTPSKSVRKDRTSAYTGTKRHMVNGRGGAVGGREKGRVTISTIKQAINEATTSSMQQYLRNLPLSAKLFLAALLGRIRRTGIRETVMGEIMDEAKRIGKMADYSGISKYLLSEFIHSSSGGSSSLGNTMMNQQIPRALGMIAAATSLMDAGVIGLESRRGDRAARVRLNVGEDEIKLALRDDGEVKGLGFSA